MPVDGLRQVAGVRPGQRGVRDASSEHRCQSRHVAMGVMMTLLVRSSFGSSFNLDTWFRTHHGQLATLAWWERAQAPRRRSDGQIQLVRLSRPSAPDRWGRQRVTRRGTQRPQPSCEQAGRLVADQPCAVRFTRSALRPRCTHEATVPRLLWTMSAISS